ncbi:hypothetical protein Tco_0039099 [Tanacetum coccineum]
MMLIKTKALLLDHTEGTSKSQPKSIIKYAQAEETVFEAGDTQELQNQGQDMRNTDDQPNVEEAPKHDYHVELKYNFKVCYKAVTDRLDWNNPKGKEYSFNLSKPLPLIMNQGRQVVPVDYLINNDLEYLRGGSSSKKYTTSTTKTKATKYDILGIKYMGPKRQRFYGFTSNRVSKYDVYSTKRIIAVTKLKVMKCYDYGYPEEIEVRREDQQLYKFNEGDFPRLHLHDIEDIRIVILKRVEDLHLGVESYQKKLNITKPETFRSNISNKTPYTAYNNPQGIIYVDKYNRNRLMCSDELYKFSDGI